MTIIHSSLFQTGSKSLGNITIRTSRGQVILSSKIIKNNSRTQKQVSQRNGFGETAKIARSLSPIINIGYKKPATGTKRNSFIQANTAIAQYARQGHLYNYDRPPVTNLCFALDNPVFEGKIYTGIGEYDVNAVWGWGPGEALEGLLKFRRKFMAEDILTVGLCYSYMEMGDYYENVRLFEKKLTQEEIDALPDKQKFVLNSTTFPGIDVFGDLPEDAGSIEILVTALVSNENETSTSLLQPMPDIFYLLSVATQTTASSDSVMVVTDSNPEAFAARLEGKLEGSVLRVYSTFPDSYYDFPFKEYAKDASDKVNGIVVSPPDGKVSILMENLIPAEKSYIQQGNEKLAEVTNIMVPSFVE